MTASFGSPARDGRVAALLGAARANPALAAALLVLVAGGASIAGAWYMQLGLGYMPCPLCLQQRIPYYVALPVAAAVALGAWRGAPAGWLRAGLGLVALLMLIGAGIAAYHAGVEWRWWPGPTDCAAVPIRPIGSVNDLIAQMRSVRLVRCDEPALVVLGLSLAGWNALITFALAAVAAAGALRASYGSSSVSQ